MPKTQLIEDSYQQKDIYTEALDPTPPPKKYDAFIPPIEQIHKIKHSFHSAKKKWHQTQIGGSHYKKMRIPVNDFSHANNLSPSQHSVIKYVCRYKEKNGLEDLEKAKHFIDYLIAEYKDEQEGNGYEY